MIEPHSEMSELESEINIRRNYLGISDEEDFGCKVTDEERFVLFSMKKRIARRVSRIIDEEVRRAIYKLKTGKDY